LDGLIADVPQVIVRHKQHVCETDGLAWPVRSTARVELSARAAALFFGRAGH
jgi:hypothetical protein